MQQTFYKTINGHKFEFNRLLYPISYHIFSKEIEAEVTMFSMAKDETGTWTIKESENLPLWLSQMSTELQEVILENEASKVLSLID